MTVSPAPIPATRATGNAKRCDGFPQCGCSNEATEHWHGYELCADCARKFNAPDPDKRIVAMYPVGETQVVRLPAECIYCEGWRKLADDGARGMAAAGRDVERMEKEIAGLRAENTALQLNLYACAETSGYVWRMLDTLLVGPSPGRAAIKRAMVRLCPDFKVRP